jgi:hypothetical protein
MLHSSRKHTLIVIVFTSGDVMKRKPLEADLDPAGTRHTRPGSKIAESAVANAKKPRKRKAGPGSAAPSRPGSTAAARAVDATRRKTGRK